MRFITIIITIIVCIIYCSCKPKPICSITKDDLLQHNKDLVFAVDTTNPFTDYRDLGIDSIVGSYYSFYKNGQLKEYDFFIGKDTANYKTQYDSLGRLIYQRGEPLVRKTAELLGDSLAIKFFLLTLNINYKSIVISFSDTMNVPLKLTFDSSFSNVQSVSYVIRGLTEPKIINGTFTIEYENICVKETRKFIDSIRLEYKGSQ